MAKVLAKDLAESWGRGTIVAQTVVDAVAIGIADPVLQPWKPIAKTARTSRKRGNLPWQSKLRF